MNHLTSLIDMMDLSLFESLSSRAITTQLAMIVMMMIHSKGGQFTCVDLIIFKADIYLF